MEYIEDLDSKYVSDIMTHLRAYNFEHTGVKESSEDLFYALRNETLVGGVETSLFWDWVSIEDLFYDNIETLEKLVSAIKEHYKDRAFGLKLITEIQSRAEALEAIGFKRVGVVDGTPKTNTSYHLQSDLMSASNDVCPDVKVLTERNEVYNDIFSNQVAQFNAENGVRELPEENRVFVALDQDVFAGGIQIRIVEDTMHINRLVVKHEYRGQDIGTKLMALAEDLARKLDLYHISVGTVAFQARAFYEKLGYEVVLVKENEPKGYQSYKLIKGLRGTHGGSQ